MDPNLGLVQDPISTSTAPVSTQQQQYIDDPFDTDDPLLWVQLGTVRYNKESDSWTIQSDAIRQYLTNIWDVELKKPDGSIQRADMFQMVNILKQLNKIYYYLAQLFHDDHPKYHVTPPSNFVEDTNDVKLYANLALDRMKQYKDAGMDRAPMTASFLYTVIYPYFAYLGIRKGSMEEQLDRLEYLYVNQSRGPLGSFIWDEYDSIVDRETRMDAIRYQGRRLLQRRRLFYENPTSGDELLLPYNPNQEPVQTFEAMLDDETGEPRQPLGTIFRYQEKIRHKPWAIRLLVHWAQRLQKMAKEANVTLFKEHFRRKSQQEIEMEQELEQARQRYRGTWKMALQFTGNSPQRAAESIRAQDPQPIPDDVLQTYLNE